MVIKPMIRGNICINSHPAGCAKAVQNEIAYTKEQFRGNKCENPPRMVLVIGCSTGYGLASRIVAGFGYGAATIGVSLEKPATESRAGTPGWYNNLCFDAEAAAAGLPAKTLNIDAFSNEAKSAVAGAVKDMASGIPARVDLVVYSLASPVRTDPATGAMYRSVVKPIGAPYSGRTFDLASGKISVVSVKPANDEEIASTVKVMGGEDWELWMDALGAADILSPSCRSVAYTYIGPELSWGIYKNGTIGRAKEDLERAARAINQKFAVNGGGGRAWVSVNKALVTRASAVIPIIPLYIASLFKVMKAKGLHEGCIEQITRLYRERLYTAEAAFDPQKVPVDGEGRIRIDDLEMRDDVQKAAAALLDRITEENIYAESDAAGFRHDFLEAHGFDVAGVDYGLDN